MTDCCSYVYWCYLLAPVVHHDRLLLRNGFLFLNNAAALSASRSTELSAALDDFFFLFFFFAKEIISPSSKPKDLSYSIKSVKDVTVKSRNTLNLAQSDAEMKLQDRWYSRHQCNQKKYTPLFTMVIENDKTMPEKDLGSEATIVYSKLEKKVNHSL